MRRLTNIYKTKQSRIYHLGGYIQLNCDSTALIFVSSST